MENEIMTNEMDLNNVEAVEEVIVEVIDAPETQTNRIWPLVIGAGFGVIGIAVAARFIQKSKTVDKLAVKRLEKKGYVIYRPDEVVETEAESYDENVDQDTTEE